MKDSMMDITYDVNTLLEWGINDAGLKVSGCGMDMHFHTMDCLTYALYGTVKPEGFKGNGGSCLNWQSL